MFCFKCGTEIPDESEFCMKCGVKIPKDNISNNSTEVNLTLNLTSPYTPDKLYNMFGENKMDAIKYVAHDSGMKLRDAKNLVENAYETFKYNPTPAEQRIEYNKQNGIACCPKCGSTSITANKKGFGIGKAVAGAQLIGNPIGLVAGNKGAKKVIATCLNCGHRWKVK